MKREIVLLLLSPSKMLLESLSEMLLEVSLEILFLWRRRLTIGMRVHHHRMLRFHRACNMMTMVYTKVAVL